MFRPWEVEGKYRPSTLMIGDEDEGCIYGRYEVKSTVFMYNEGEKFNYDI
jgi:hypothetical protein